MDLKKIVVGISCATAMSFANAGPTQTYVAPFGTDGAGTGLQDTLNGITKDGVFDLDVTQDQYQPNETWTIDAAGNANAVMMFEIAGNDTINSMGIYDLENTSNRLSLFDGAATNAYSSLLLVNPADEFVINQFDAAGNYIVAGHQSGTFSSFNFGFYLETPNGTFYSQDALNNDLDGDGVNDEHMLAFQGTGTDKVNTKGGTHYGDFTSNNFILAWEDLAFNADGVDFDYNDMVVMVESFLPVPEPGTLALLGLGLAGLGAARRRQKA